MNKRIIDADSMQQTTGKGLYGFRAQDQRAAGNDQDESAARKRFVSDDRCSGVSARDRQSGSVHEDAQQQDELFMYEALAEAQAAAAAGEVPIGAVVVYQGEVIARAYNRRELDEDPSAHAEFSALVAAAHALGRWRLTGCTVYVTLEPCLMCAGLMVNARIDRCVYGAADPKGGALGSLYRLNNDVRLNHAFEVTAGVCADECSAALKDFFAALRNGSRPGNDAHDAKRDAAQQQSRYAEESGSGTAGAKTWGANAQCASAEDQSMCAAGGLFYLSQVAPRVLLAIDSFKDSATSAQAEAWVAEGIRHAAPDAEITCVPIGDGGEGTAEALAAAGSSTWRTVRVHDAFGQEISARYLLADVDTGEVYRGDAYGVADGVEARERTNHTAEVSSSGTAHDELDTRRRKGADAGTEDADAGAEDINIGTEGIGTEDTNTSTKDADIATAAFIEIASAAGLSYSDRTAASALVASTYGVGELVLDAIAQGARTVYLGLGGSATTDGGAGFLQALGAQLLDADGHEIPAGLAGLEHVASINLAPAMAGLQDVRLYALSDVTNPLVGARGAVRVFGLQKGLPQDSDALAMHDRWMIHYGALLDAACRTVTESPFRSLPGVPGAGAAGGLGAAVLALGGTLMPGIDAVLERANFDELLRSCDFVVTGEGMMDSQTAGGKAPLGVARRAQAAGVPVVAVVGGRSDDLDAVYDQGINLVLPIVRRPMDLAKALTPEQTHANLEAAGETVVRAYLLGRMR